MIDNEGDIYTVDSGVFAHTYQNLGPGKYAKNTAVWAKVATDSGSIKTKEGQSHYTQGKYLVYNNEDGTDAYCMGADKFEAMYVLDENC